MKKSARDCALDSDATQCIRVQEVVMAPANQPSLHRVQRVAGYELLDELGRGGMGVVYRAWQQNLQRHVALKMILAGSFAGSQELDRFRAEAMAIARLHHPHLLSIHEIGETGGLPFYAMEYMEGGSLARRLTGEPIPPRIAAPLVRALAQAMDYAHRNGIVHRDLKPANILLSGNTDTPLEECVAKITDFGVAKLLHQDSSYTRTGDILGTPHYMAPEQASGRPTQVGPAADVYSLGAILYELLTGRTPFQGATGTDVLLTLLRDEPERPSQWVRTLPRDLETICMKCLEKDPARRYASAAALAEDLLHFMRSEPIQARPTSTTDRVLKWAKRRPATAAVLVMGLTLAVVGFGLMVGMWRQAVDNAAKQDEMLLDTKALLADALLERGIHLSEKGDIRRGMHWMMRSLEICDRIEQKKKVPHELTPIIRMNLAAWGQCVYPREMLLPHNDWIWDVAFSPDDRFVATASKDRTVQVWNTQSSATVGPPLAHPDPVWGLRFHPDGKTLFTICGPYSGTGPGRLHVWTMDPQQPGQFVPRGQPLECSDGLWLLNLNAVGDRLWIASGKEAVAHLVAFDAGAPGNGLSLVGDRLPGRHTQGTFSHDGKLLATVLGEAGERGSLSTSQVQLWNGRTGEPLGEPFTHAGMVRTIEFSRDDRFLIVGSATGKSQEHGETSLLNVWSVAERKRIASSPPLQGRLRAATIAPNGSMFAVSLFEHAGRRNDDGRLQITDGHVALWNLHRDGSIAPFGTPLRTGHVVWHMQFSPDSRMVLAGCENFGSYLWSVSNGERLVPVVWHDGNCVRVAFSHDGRTAVTASAGGTFNASARLWDVPKFGHIGRAMTPTSSIRTVYWEQGGTHAWIGTARAHGRWDPFRGVLVEEIPLPANARWFHPAPSDQQFLGQFTNEDLKLYDRTTGQFTALPYLPLGPRPECLYHFFPESGYLIEHWTKHSRFCLRDRQGRALTRQLHEPEYDLIANHMNRQGTCLAVSQSMGRTNRIVLYDPKDLQVRHEVPVKHSVQALAFTPDGKTLAFGGRDRQVQRLDVETGEPIGSPLLHEENVHWVDFVNSDRLLMTCSGKGTVLLWDARTGKRIGPAFEHQADLGSIAVHPQGKYVLTGTHETIARAWHVSEPVVGSLDRIKLWVETVTGMEMTEGEAIVMLDMERVMEKREELARLGGAPLR